MSRPGDGVAPVFRVVILYEDFEAAGRAKRAYDFLVANLDHEWRINRQMWSFGLLHIPELREAATEDAMLAHVIVISCGGGELPAEVKEWIETWQANDVGPVALIAMFDATPEHAGRVQAARACLSRVAKRGRMDFFTWPEVEFVESAPPRNSGLDRPAEPVGELFRQAA